MKGKLSNTNNDALTETNPVNSGLEGIMQRQLQKRIKILHEEYNKSNEIWESDPAAFSEKMDNFMQKLDADEGIDLLPLFCGIKRQQQHSSKPLSVDVKGSLPQVTLETLFRNMRQYDVRNSKEQPCLSLKEDADCVFSSLCAQLNHPLLGSKSTTPCGTGFKYDGEDFDDVFPARVVPRRHCVFCILFQVNTEIDSMEACEASVQHAATAINPFSVIASPEVGGASEEIFRPSHPLIHGNFPIFDAMMIPGYMLMSEKYRIFHPLTDPSVDVKKIHATDSVMALCPPWRICLEKGVDGKDLHFGGVMSPDFVRMDCVVGGEATESNSGEKHWREIAHESLGLRNEIRLTTGTSNDIRTSVSTNSRIHDDIHYHFVAKKRHSHVNSALPDHAELDK
jgi:hypothetical protein